MTIAAVESEGRCIVIDPWPRIHRRREPGLEEKLNTLLRGEPAQVVELFLAERDEFALPVAPLCQFLNQRMEDVRDLLQGMPAIRIVGFEGEQLYTTEQKWQALAQALLAALRDFHAAHPLAPGRDMEELRDRLPGRIRAN